MGYIMNFLTGEHCKKQISTILETAELSELSGGSHVYCVFILNQFKTEQSVVTVHIDTKCASSDFLIFLANLLSVLCLFSAFLFILSDINTD